MIFDALVSFIPIGSPLSVVGGSGATFRSGIIDLLGQGVGTAPQNIIGTGRAVFGTDLGVGSKRPELNITVGTGLTGTVGTTLKVALQAAIDNGSYQPGTWIDIDSEDNIGLANATNAPATAGSVIFRSPWIPTFPPGLMPRFLSLLFSPQYGTPQETPNGSFTAGTIASALVTMVRDDYAAKYANKNFTVG